MKQVNNLLYTNLVYFCKQIGKIFKKALLALVAAEQIKKLKLLWWTVAYLHTDQPYHSFGVVSLAIWWMLVPYLLSFCSVFGLYHLPREMFDSLAAKSATVFTSKSLFVSVCCLVLGRQCTAIYSSFYTKKKTKKNQLK